jgi:hypothetical protein
VILECSEPIVSSMESITIGIEEIGATKKSARLRDRNIGWSWHPVVRQIQRFRTCPKREMK